MVYPPTNLSPKPASPTSPTTYLMTHQTGCLICGGDLEYLDEPEEIRCMYCGELFSTTCGPIEAPRYATRCQRLECEDIIELSCIQARKKIPSP